MDKSFNGLRYSSSQDCLIDDGGEKIHMRHSSNQIFLLLIENLNKLVTREHLLDKVPTKGSDSDDSLNECIDEIKHVVGDDRLKTVSRVGYLLTADTSTNEPANSLGNGSIDSSTVKSTNSPVRRRPAQALLQDLLFNSQWVICAYQKHQRAWLGALALLAVFLLSPASSTVSPTMGHMAFDRSDASTCSSLLTDCAACVPDFWQTSSVMARSNWFLSTGCNPGN